MKKCTFLVVALAAISLSVAAQDIHPTMDESPDSIKVSYVPNSFGDNWEISLSGGASFLFSGVGHIKETTSAPVSGTGFKTYDAVGGVGEIAATKWFNPYIAGRIGWMTGYLPYSNPNPNSKLSYWHNYAHVDMLWDWTTQFGGYKPARKYDAVPYVHVGLVGNPGYNVMMGGGVGFLNRFHINKHWLIHLDLRATATSSRKFGLPSGVAVEADALLGVRYRFNEAGWKKKIVNPYAAEVRRLNDENEDLEHQLAELRMKNQELARRAQAQQADDHAKEQVVKEVFRGLPDTLEMTVYYAISSSKLSGYEQAHLRTYLRMIALNDPNNEHKFLVIGTADKGTGSLEYNQKLSAARADAIKQALIDNGVKESQIEMQTQVVPSGDAKMARASHVIMYPLPKDEK